MAIYGGGEWIRNRWLGQDKTMTLKYYIHFFYVIELFEPYILLNLKLNKSKIKSAMQIRKLNKTCTLLSNSIHVIRKKKWLQIILICGKIKILWDFMGWIVISG